MPAHVPRHPLQPHRVFHHWPETQPLEHHSPQSNSMSSGESLNTPDFGRIGNHFLLIVRLLAKHTQGRTERFSVVFKIDVRAGEASPDCGHSIRIREGSASRLCSEGRPACYDRNHVLRMGRVGSAEN